MDLPAESQRRDGEWQRISVAVTLWPIRGGWLARRLPGVFAKQRHKMFV
jgi:hypothetical protein